MKTSKNRKFIFPYLLENVSTHLLRILEPRQHLKTSFFITFDSYWASGLLRFEILDPTNTGMVQSGYLSSVPDFKDQIWTNFSKILAALTFFSGNILSIGQKILNSTVFLRQTPEYGL